MRRIPHGCDGISLLSNELSDLYPLANARGWKTHNSLDKNHLPSKAMRGTIIITIKFEYMYRVE